MFVGAMIGSLLLSYRSCSGQPTYFLPGQFIARFILHSCSFADEEVRKVETITDTDLVLNIITLFLPRNIYEIIALQSLPAMHIWEKREENQEK